MTILCHYCEEAEGEYDCPTCGKLTCEDCFEPCTVFNAGYQQDCKGCVSKKESELVRVYEERESREKEAQKIKDERNTKARSNYWKPENIEKRKIKKQQRKEEQAELKLKQLDELKDIFINLFR